MPEEKPTKEYHRIKFSIKDLDGLRVYERNVAISKTMIEQIDKPKIKGMLQKAADTVIDAFLEETRVSGEF